MKVVFIRAVSVPSYNHPTVTRYSHGDGDVSGEMFATIDHFILVSIVT